MLHTQTVRPELLELLKKLMNEPLFKDFNLVGGTALALQIGHRNSIDIDLFGESTIKENFISFFEFGGNVVINTKTKMILQLAFNEIKVDFVNYSYPLLETPIIIDGIRLVSKKDIAAMKLNAIAGRGSKKDFIDLYFLFEYFTLREMLSFYEQKYHNGNVFVVLKSLNYFADADQQVEPIMHKNFDWENAKIKIQNELDLVL